MIMVMGAILLALYNTDVILKFPHLFYRGRKRLTVIFKTALSYPASKRFRTGATVAMFALVLLSAFCSAVRKAITVTESNTRANMATVAPVLNLLLAG